MKGDRAGTKESVNHKKYHNLVRVRTVRPLDGFEVHVTFTDGTERVIDLDKHIWGPVFETIRSDPALFRAMHVEDGAITWPGDVDLDPDTLYYGDNPIPWMVEYEEQQKKKKARQLRERAARKATKPQRKSTQARTSKKRAVKSAPTRKKVLAKSK